MAENNRLNTFDIDPNVPLHFENQLTRAFLIVLRLSPAAHQVWLKLVGTDHWLYQLPKPTFDTQRSQMYASAPEVTEPIQGISVLQAADVQREVGSIQITDRGQVLDGIVMYGDELLIVIETKLAGPMSTRQAESLNLHGADVKFDGSVRSVDWRDLLAAWTDLVQSESVSGTERKVISDFLDYTEQYFPKLGPFTTIARCNEDEFRVCRRLRAILDQIAGSLTTNSWLDLLDRSVVSRAILKFDGQSKLVSLLLYPADTLTQARALYSSPEIPQNLLSLRHTGWAVSPNFHFGFRASGLVWTTSDATADEYVDYWLRRIAETRPVPREGWENFWIELVQQRFAKVEEKQMFDQSFTQTGRNMATPRPGLKCRYSWSIVEAAHLDEREQLSAEVKRKVNELLQALEERPL